MGRSSKRSINKKREERQLAPSKATKLQIYSVLRDRVLGLCDGIFYDFKKLRYTIFAKTTFCYC